MLCLLVMQLFLKVHSATANNADPDQMGPLSGSALFAYAILSKTLVYESQRHLL